MCQIFAFHDSVVLQHIKNNFFLLKNTKIGQCFTKLLLKTRAVCHSVHLWFASHRGLTMHSTRTVLYFSVVETFLPLFRCDHSLQHFLAYAKDWGCLKFKPLPIAHTSIRVRLDASGVDLISVFMILLGLFAGQNDFNTYHLFHGRN